MFTSLRPAAVKYEFLPKSKSVHELGFESPDGTFPYFFSAISLILDLKQWDRKKRHQERQNRDLDWQLLMPFHYQMNTPSCWPLPNGINLRAGKCCGNDEKAGPIHKRLHEEDFYVCSFHLTRNLSHCHCNWKMPENDHYWTILGKTKDNDWTLHFNLSTIEWKLHVSAS